ncbi:hypothetical protein ACIBXA_20910 [Micromonospora echinaurantiaca]|uniref:hypothetical protein n=1 Tax=Micromonospora echinaurantiaca TaxID=47857 RepID=UPI0037A593EA
MPSELTVVDPPATPAAEPTPPETRRRRTAALVAAALLAAWLVPVVAYAMHRAWLLPPLLLLGTASLLRGGRTLLDRLLLATMLLLGATTAAGLLVAVWPWGLHPVPVNGTALTVLVLAAVATGRRPRLPRPGWVDLFPVLGTAALVGYLAQPLLRAGDLATRLTLLGRGEDNYRHLALFDVVGRAGGYVFVDPAAAREQIVSALVHYPQGWHLTTALLDGHLTPIGAAARGAGAVEPYLWWTVAGFGLLTLTLLWVAQRIPGPLHPLHRTVLTVVVGALILGTQLPRLLIAGYPTEVLGLTLAVALAGLVIRPLAGTREQLVLLGALLTGIGFSYYLFLPAAVVLALCWFAGHRREALRAWPTLLAVALVTVPLAATTPLLGLLRADHAEALAAPIGRDVTQTWRALLWLGGLVVLALVVQVRRSDRAWRRTLLVMLVGAGFALAIAQASINAGGQPAYYFNKAGHLATALFIVGTAGLVRLLPTPRRDRGLPRRIATTAAATVTGVALAATAVTYCGVTGWHRGILVTDEWTWAQRWVHQHLEQPVRAAVVCAEVDRAYPPVPWATTFILDRGPYRSYLEGLCLSALQGTTAQSEPGVYGMVFLEPDRTREMLRRTPGPVRFVVADPGARRRIEKLLIAEPELHRRVTVEVMLIPEPYR